MRDGVIPSLRLRDPSARIIHELNIDHGTHRVDIAAIGRDSLTFVELKSKKDKLDRLEDQVATFGRAGHTLIVLLDEKWFGPRYADRIKPFLYRSHELELWKWPKPPEGAGWKEHAWRWPHMPQHQGVEPHARRLLELLWRDELHNECERHRILADSRSTRWPMIQRLAYHLTGKEVAEAVCRQLRARPMAEGDPPC